MSTPSGISAESALGNLSSHHWPRRVSRKQQFKAILRKNFLLQIRGRKSFLGLEGWAAPLFELLVPAAFFILMCIPRHEIDPVHNDVDVTPPADLGSSSFSSWANPYDGPAKVNGYRATILFSPNTSSAAAVMQNFARAVACPADPGQKADMSTAFPALFRSSNPDAACNDYAHCIITAACSQHVLDSNLMGLSSAREAEEYVTAHPDKVDAVVDLQPDQLQAHIHTPQAAGLNGLSFGRISRQPATNAEALNDSSSFAYAIRLNHTYLPSNRELLNAFDVVPNAAYQNYWLFANVQMAVDRAILGMHLPQADQPADVRVAYKPFPWPAVTFDPAAVAASAAFNLLLVYAFLAPTRNVVATVVREKELRLREGMRILGLRDTAYWASWAITHWATLGASGLLCAFISIYPFPNSDFTVLLALLWLIAAALVAFSYALSTLFSSSREAGTVAAFVYAASMVPGWLAPSAQPYGGWLWVVSCLSPPSAISLFANVLLKLESAQRGLHWRLLSLSVTQQGAFSAATVMGMLLLDVLLYGLLTWYLDRVIPSEFGQNLPFYFPLLPAHWSSHASVGTAKPASRLPESHPLRSAASEECTTAVSIQSLTKVFPGRGGEEKTALDRLCVDMYQGQITALLGHNGAGKTTAISILTGMIPATSGDAFVGSKSVASDMGAIRNNLGVCPQFDILWPDLTVDEHLQLYAAIKGYRDADAPGVAAEAAHDVGLEDKLGTRAGELSGGHRRKLSVAIAFLGAPDIVFLDEPTSGMDPFSRRFTWEIIKRHRENRAVVLTTHSMEEADRLADRIIIMAQGQAAAAGSSLDLKNRYGVGYTLTLALSGSDSPPGTDAGSRDGEGASWLPASGTARTEAISGLIRGHMASAELVSSSAREAAFRLPRDESSGISGLLQDIERKKRDLGILSYGLSSTTLEEVFLNVSASKGVGHKEEDAGQNPAETRINVDGGAEASESAETPGNAQLQLRGLRLYGSQLWALSAKRTQIGLRDARSALFQVVVPVALVAMSLWVRKATFSAATEPALDITRSVCLRGSPTVLAASQQARANASVLNAFASGYGGYLVDSGTDHVARSSYNAFAGSLDEYLLHSWWSGLRSYDAVHVQRFSSPSQVLGMEGPVMATLTTNQTAIHAIPAAINAFSNALLSSLTGGQASIAVSSNPMPNLPGEQAVQLSILAGTLFLVVGMTSAVAVLAASFVLVPVAEAESGSKQLQRLAGAPASALWISNLAWDMLVFSLSAAGVVMLFFLFDIPQFQGERLQAFALLFWAFGFAAIPQAYLLHFLFKDEVKAGQRLLQGGLLVGFLGFITTWILDLVYLYGHSAGVQHANNIVQVILRAVAPHFLLSRGLYTISETYKQQSIFPQPNTSPWTWEASGQFYFWAMIQFQAYLGFTLLVEMGLLRAGGYQVRRLWRTLRQALAAGRLRVRTAMDREPSHAASGGYARLANGEGERAEDEDVKQERIKLQRAGAGAQQSMQVLIAGLRKAYWQGPLEPSVLAVKGLWAGIPKGDCFGLLGVNGAGKTTTFKVITGEETPDEGDVSICGASVAGSLRTVRRQLGYCPQHSALPGKLTGREALRLYARLRGVVPAQVEGVVASLLQRLDLSPYADRACEMYSRGNKRKLSVALALVGSPPVVLLDEPSTGMDPGAKRFLWRIIRSQVIDQGHTVVLTSHSMEECEALCTRLGIMAAGRLVCLGSPQHLKSRFGAGYVLEVRRQTGTEVQAVDDFVRGACASVGIHHHDSYRSSYLIPRQALEEGLDLPQLFASIEQQKETLGIDEYSVSQTTLEHVFVALAQGAQEQGAAGGQNASWV